MPVPDACPICGAKRGDEWDRLPDHIKEECGGGLSEMMAEKSPLTDGAVETAAVQETRPVPVDHVFEPGDWAVDIDPAKVSDGRPVLLVIDQTDELASEHPVWEEPDGSMYTVADYHNGKYADSPVVLAVHKESLDHRLGGNGLPAWTVRTVLELYESGTLEAGPPDGWFVRVYPYPEDRLEKYDADEE